MSVYTTGADLDIALLWPAAGYPDGREDVARQLAGGRAVDVREGNEKFTCRGEAVDIGHWTFDELHRAAEAVREGDILRAIPLAGLIYGTLLVYPSPRCAAVLDGLWTFPPALAEAVQARSPSVLQGQLALGAPLGLWVPHSDEFSVTCLPTRMSCTRAHRPPAPPGS